MSTPTDEIILDIDALDAAAAGKKADLATKTPETNKKSPEVPEIKVETAPAPEKAALSPEEGLDKLKKQLEDERKRGDDERAGRLAAEQRANEAAAAEAEARGNVQTTQLDLVKGAIDRVTQANDVLEGQYADAMAAQDFKGAAKVQRQMADNSAKLAQLEAGKSALEKAPRPTPRVATDPVEAFASSLSPSSAAWVRAHPEYVRDPQKNKKMLAAHSIALADGCPVDTPAYFKSIEETLKIAPIIVKPPETDPADDPMIDAAQPANGSGRQPAAAAPVSRSGNGNGSRPNTVRLTPAEAEIAEMMGMTPEDYARNKLALKKEGKLS